MLKCHRLPDLREDVKQANDKEKGQMDKLISA